ncbi:neuron navigator 2-like protein [Leptotrombidium deliense]|uniref:Neuron navigator 2-like protein n=1 Tax=Leptotrombidium deliense TaxID=299467 RepID=A0A443SA03_9ACAR|nr:neuron navigator 2-like protein [Leptotrombidium deliense]
MVRSASSDRGEDSGNNGWFRKVLKKHRSRKDSDAFSEIVSSSLSAPNTPQLTAKSAKSSEHNEQQETEEVKALKKELLEKEKLLTDLRLEALTTGNQMDVIKEKMNKMVIELEALRKENNILQQQMHQRSITSSIASLNGCKDSCEYDNKALLKVGKENIGTILIQTATNWEEFNHIIKAKFSQYLSTIDPEGSLGLTVNDISSYEVGVEKVERRLSRYDPLPELLPFGYLVEENVITIKLRSKLDYLVLQTMISKSSLEKLLNIVQEYHRLILYGSPGIGKSFVAKCIAHYLVSSESEYFYTGECNAPGSVAIINVERNSDEDLSDYLSNIIESDSFSAQLLPNVIVIDCVDNIKDASKTLSLLNGNNGTQW